MKRILGLSALALIFGIGATSFAAARQTNGTQTTTTKTTMQKTSSTKSSTGRKHAKHYRHHKKTVAKRTHKHSKTKKSTAKTS